MHKKVFVLGVLATLVTAVFLMTGHTSPVSDLATRRPIDAATLQRHEEKVRTCLEIVSSRLYRTAREEGLDILEDRLAAGGLIQNISASALSDINILINTRCGNNHKAVVDHFGSWPRFAKYGDFDLVDEDEAILSCHALPGSARFRFLRADAERWLLDGIVDEHFLPASPGAAWQEFLRASIRKGAWTALSNCEFARFYVDHGIDYSAETLVQAIDFPRLLASFTILRRIGDHYKVGLRVYNGNINNDVHAYLCRTGSSYAVWKIENNLKEF